MVDKKYLSYDVRMKPIKYFMLYYILTFLIFITSDLAATLPNTITVIVFVSFSYISLYFGYWFGVKTKGNNYIIKSQTDKKKLANILIIIGAAYYIVWGVNQMVDFGANSIGNVVANIMNPGESYKNKFDVFESRVLNSSVNRLTQILILLSFFGSVFVILFVVYCNKLKLKTKLFGLFAIVIYLASFLYIGTQKGIGDVIIYIMVGFSLFLASGNKLKRATRIKIYSFIFAFIFILFIYMIFTQSSRVSEFGQQTTLLYGDVSNSLMASIFGEQSAIGFYNAISYPSHGYAGLAYNMTQDFQFSYGAGLSPAFESYRLQFFGGTSNLDLTYPFRTEVATGWPAGMYWATAFPWFASDLSYFGVILFMFFIGFLFARTWIRAITHVDILSYALLGQLFILLLYLPANNQIFMQRQGLWVILTLLLAALFRELMKKKYYV